MNKKVIVRLLGATLMLLGWVSSSQAQDGKALYEEHCKLCHKADKKATGPALRNIRAQWAENVEDSSLLYLWVNNWKAAEQSEKLL